MENTRRRKRAARFLSKNWYEKLSPEEIQQEELIQAWEKPDLEGYEGLLAYNELLFKDSKDSRLKTVELKKNTPGVLTPDVSFDAQIVEVLDCVPESIRGYCSVLIQGCIQEGYYGQRVDSIRSLAKLLRLPKSSMHYFLS